MTTSTRKVLEEVAGVLNRAAQEEMTRQNETAVRTVESLIADITNRIAYSRAVLKNMGLGSVGVNDQHHINQTISKLEDCLIHLKQVRTSQDLTPELLRDVTAQLATHSQDIADMAKRAG